MKYPLIPVCLSFISGIIIAYLVPLPCVIFLMLALACVTGGFLLFNKPSYSNIIVFAAFVFAGAAAYSNSRFLPNNHVSRLNYISEEITLKGVVADEPVIRKKGAGFLLQAGKVTGQDRDINVSGLVLVRQSGGTKVAYGDAVSLRGKINWQYNLAGVKSFGGREFDYREYLRRRMVYSVFRVKKDGLIEVGGFKGNPVKKLAFSLRDKVRDVFEARLSPLSSALYTAMLLGPRDKIPLEVNQVLMKLGTIHILSVSGLHTVIVAFIFLMILKLARIARKARFILAIAALIFYCLLTGASVPVIRSVIVAVILLFGCVIERRVNIYNSLALSALLILGVHPNQLFDIGFQLSFGSILSILMISERINLLIPDEFRGKKYVKFWLPALNVSFSAWIGTLGLVLYYFGIISTVSVIANIIIVPYVSLIIACGFLLAFSAFLPGFICSAIAASCELLMVIFMRITYLLAKIPWAYFTLPEIPFPRVLVYYSLIIFLMFIASKRFFRRVPSIAE